jgi:hypothetical protein
VHIDFQKKLNEDHKLYAKKERFLIKLKELEIQFHHQDYSGKILGTKLKVAIFSVGAGVAGHLEPNNFAEEDPVDGSVNKDRLLAEINRKQLLLKSESLKGTSRRTLKEFPT